MQSLQLSTGAVSLSSLVFLAAAISTNGFVATATHTNDNSDVKYSQISDNPNLTPNEKQRIKRKIDSKTTQDKDDPEIHELEDETWSYDAKAKYGPANWGKLPMPGNPDKLKYPECNGKRQSPIAFWKNDIVVNASLQPLEFLGYNTPIPKDSLYIKNNGHTFEVDVKSAQTTHRRISGGSLGTWYQLVQFHFHWSQDDTSGSEHVVGDTSNYPLVTHWVHTKEGMPVGDALKLPDGLAVIGVTYELTDLISQENKELNKITSHLDDVKFKSSKQYISEEVTLDNLFPKNRDNYFRYEGSLTTPPCSEAVIWTVLTDTINVTRVQLHQFRNLLETSKKQDRVKFMAKNYRPVQALNGRKIQVRSMVEERKAISRSLILDLQMSPKAGISLHTSTMVIGAFTLLPILLAWSS